MLIIDWIRHTSLQIDGSYSYGQTDVQVSDNFEVEAAAVRDRLDGISYDAIYTSPLSRAKKLAHYCGYTNAIEDHRIKEIFLGEWEMKKWADIIMYDNLDDWFANFHNLTAPGGENLQDLLDRVMAFIQDARLKRYSRIAVFCHGGVINCARYMNAEISKALIFREVPMYGSVNTIKYSYLDQHDRAMRNF